MSNKNLENKFFDAIERCFSSSIHSKVVRIFKEDFNSDFDLFLQAMPSDLLRVKSFGRKSLAAVALAKDYIGKPFEDNGYIKFYDITGKSLKKIME